MQRRPRPKTAAAARVHSTYQIAITTLAVLLAMSLCLLATSARGQAKPASSLSDLEIRVWTADAPELLQIENEIVRHIQTTPRSAKAHYLLAQILMRNFERDPSDLYVLKQASDIAKQAIDLEPYSDVGYVALANILDMMGQSERGIQLLDAAETATIAPSWRFYFTRARLIADKAKFENILGLLETALGFVDAKSQIIVPYVVAMLRSSAHGDDLIKKLQSWNKRYPSHIFDLTIAMTYSELGRPKRAGEIYAKILQALPRQREAKVNYGIILYQHLNDAARAVGLLREALAEHDADMTIPAKATTLAHLGAAQLARQQFTQADIAFRQAISLDPQNLGLVDFTTRNYRDKKADIQLVELIRSLNEHVPGSSVLHALLGETLSEKLNQHDAALRAFSDAITLNPERSDYYNGMGLTYYRKKSYQAALKLFVAASEVDPNDATARYNEACVLSLLGRSEEAIASLAEALALDPRLSQTARHDSDFASIKGNLRFMELVQQPVGEKNDRFGELSH